MNKIKNKWFYICSFILYILLITIFSILTEKFIAPSARSFFVSQVTSNVKPDYNIVEVIIDDTTNQKIDWMDSDRKVQLLDFFKSYAKPKVIGFDMFDIDIEDIDYPINKKLVNQVKQMDNLVSAFVPENDEFNIDKKFMKKFEEKQSLNVNLKTKKHFKTLYNGIIDPYEELRINTPHYGSVLIKKDDDTGIVFDSATIVKIKDAFYPSLSLKMYLLLNKTNDVEIYDKYIYIPKTGLKIQYKYSKGIFLTPIRYYRQLKYGKEIKLSYTHIPISAYKIYETSEALKQGITPEKYPDRFDSSKPNTLLDPKLLENSVIYIGANISGPRDDVKITPIYERHPGVDIQATILDNFMSNKMLLPLDNIFSSICILLLCVPVFVLIMQTSFIKGLLCIIFLDIFYILVVILLGLKGIVFSYSVPIICQFVTSIFCYTFKFLNENRNKEQIKKAMGKYISKDVMNNVIIKNIENLGLGGKRSTVTVLFSDIRGFTSLSEKMTAEEVSLILNEYFSHMEPIITKYNGVINKFIGDAVMAIFGEPIQDSNHAQNAVKCAYEMLKKVEYLKEKWLLEGKPKIEIGIGINTGEVFIGNIGTENRMEYTVIGDTVNLASRIEGYNKVYKTNLLVSSSTYNYICDIADVIKIKEVQIRGKSKKMDIYEILRIEVE